MSRHRRAEQVRHEMTAECTDCLGSRQSLDVRWGYLADDPYAVSVDLPTAAGPVTWLLGRELLLRGLREPVGEGDVRIRPSVDRAGRANTLVELTSEDGSLEMRLRTGDLQDFLEAALCVVPLGAESCRLDADRLIHDVLSA